MHAMRKLSLVLVFLAASTALGQNRLPAVLTLPGMEKVQIRKNLRYDAQHTFDLYLPGNAKTAVPVVVLVNGVGDPNLKEWGQYITWGRLIAASGMAAVTYQTSGTGIGAQTEELLKYLKAQSGSLKIDASKIAIWAASQNVGFATSLVSVHAPEDFTAAVFFYGPMPVAPKHADQPVLVARAGLDQLSILESIDKWTVQAMALDAPLTFVTYPEGVHFFDLRNETEEARAIIRQTLDFLTFHQKNPRPARLQPVTPAQITRLALSSVDDALSKLMELRRTNPKALVIAEEGLNNLGYELLAAKKIPDAVKIFELLTKFHPSSANAFDSLGDAYEAAGRIEDAVKAAEEALKRLPLLLPEQREPIRTAAEDKIKRLKK